MAEDIDENDQFVSDEELAEEMDIPEPPKSPSLDKCSLGVMGGGLSQVPLPSSLTYANEWGDMCPPYF